MRPPKDLESLAVRSAALDLPEGWRWLRVGESTVPGDVLCDPRVPRVRTGGGQLMTDKHHAVCRNRIVDEIIAVRADFTKLGKRLDSLSSTALGYVDSRMWKPYQ